MSLEPEGLYWTWFENPVPDGFPGYNRMRDDPDGPQPSGTSGDTYYAQSPALEPSPDAQAVYRKFVLGNVSYTEAMQTLDELAES